MRAACGLSESFPARVFFVDPIALVERERDCLWIKILKRFRLAVWPSYYFILLLDVWLFVFLLLQVFYIKNRNSLLPGTLTWSIFFSCEVSSPVRHGWNERHDGICLCLTWFRLVASVWLDQRHRRAMFPQPCQHMARQIQGGCQVLPAGQPELHAEQRGRWWHRGFRERRT